MGQPHISAEPRRIPRVVLAGCFAALALEGYDLSVFGTVVPSLLSYEPWDLSPPDVGRLGAMAVVGMLVGALSAGAFMDRIGRRSMLIACVTLLSVGNGLCAIAVVPEQFAALRLVTGIGAGGLMPAVVAMVVEFSPRGRRSLNTAIVFAGDGIGGAAAALFSMLLVPDHGFRIVFAIGAVPLVVLVPFLMVAFPESPSHLLACGRIDAARQVATRYGIDLPSDAPGEFEGAAQGPKWGRRSALRAIFDAEHRRATVLFWLATFLCLLVIFGTSAWLPALMLTSGYGLSSAISFLFVMSIGAAVGTLAISPLADRFGSKTIVSAGFFIAAAALALLSTQPPAAIVYVLVALTGLGSVGTMVLLNAYVGSYYPTFTRATALGLSLGIGRLGGILGPPLGGAVLVSASSAGQFLAFAAPAAIGGMLVLSIPPKCEDLSEPGLVPSP